MARIEDRGDRLIVWNGNSHKRGALSPEFYEAIKGAVKQAQDKARRAVILTAEGPFFCSGGDLNSLIERRAMAEADRRDRIEWLHDVVRAIRGSDVPVIAAVEGGAAGAGLSLALACDMVIAAHDAKFTASYVKAGLVPDGGLTASLARCLPRQMAMETCLLARPVSAETLLRFGVVNQITPAGGALDAALNKADILAAGPRDAQRVIRGLVGAAYDQSEASQMADERNAMARAFGTDEAAEGISAFLEKRKPDFSK